MRQLLHTGGISDHHNSNVKERLTLFNMRDLIG